MSTIKKYLSLVKFAHTVFALPFALIGFCIGMFKVAPPLAVVPGFHKLIYQADLTKYCSEDSMLMMLITGANPYLTILKYFLLVVGCMVFARSAAMAFNRYLDATFDAKNPRTAVREIPAGLLKSKNVLFFVFANCVLFIACCYFINRLCFFLSPVALFIILFYSYTKRFTALCHVVLGVGLSLAPIGAYLAVSGMFALLPILFSLTVLCWVSGFDIIYALQDESFDKQYNLHSIPAAVGRIKALRISGILHIFSAGCVIYAGIYAGFGVFYWIGVVIFCSLLIYQ